MKTKKLTKTHAKGMGLVVVPEDKNRKPKKVKGALALRSIADWYIAKNGKLLVRLHHEDISDKAWDWLESDEAHGYRHPNSHLIHKIENVLPHWFDILVPQAGGLLVKVKLVGATGPIFDKRAARAVFNFKGVDFSVPLCQVEFVQRFYPKARFYMGPSLYGQDIFGNDVKHHCPLVAKSIGAVALIMPYSERPMEG